MDPGQQRRPPETGTGTPEFGPRGYLPERAAKRARKIVLREQMGLQWPVAAVLAAVVVAVAGGVYLVTGTGPPDEPHRPVVAIEEVDPRGALVVPPGSASGGRSPFGHLAVVRAGSGVRTFAVPDAGVRWCPATGRLESSDGQVWTSNGRLVGGEGESLVPVAAVVYDGVLYVDEGTTGTPPPPDLRDEQPACAS